MTGTGEVSGNTIVNFSFAALTYQSGWHIHDNFVHNDGSGPYYGFANNGSGWGIFGAGSESAGLPAIPAMPARIAWGEVLPIAPAGLGPSSYVSTDADTTIKPAGLDLSSYVSTDADMTIELVGISPTAYSE